MRREGLGQSFLQVSDYVWGLGGGGVPRTIMRPLMPTMKSNHGSIASCRLVFRRTWKPKCPCCCFWRGSSPSRRDMKRLRALNIVPGRYFGGGGRPVRVAEVYGRVLGVVDRQVQMSARAGRDVSATKFQPYCAAHAVVPRAAWAELPAGPHSSRASVELSGPCRSLSLPDFTSTFIRAFLSITSTQSVKSSSWTPHIVS